uniref:Uncharacterized protein n=1 Tax=Romanomermis culicivorax TaxID=13658 RepID=A0A915KHA7_ROMCU
MNIRSSNKIVTTSFESTLLYPERTAETTYNGMGEYRARFNNMIAGTVTKSATMLNAYVHTGPFCTDNAAGIGLSIK